MNSKNNYIRVWNHFSSALLFRHVTVRPALFSVVAKLLKERDAKRKVEAHTYRTSFHRNHLLFMKMIRRNFRNDGTITKNNAHLYKLTKGNNMASQQSIAIHFYIHRIAITFPSLLFSCYFRDLCIFTFSILLSPSLRLTATDLQCSMLS